MRRLWRVLLGRLGTVVLSLLASSLVIFLLLQTLPGDMAEVMLGTSATPETIAELRTELGLARPWWVRYAEWLGGLVTGDLGTSALSGERINDLVAGPAGVTAWLVALGLTIALLLASVNGVWAALRRRHLDGALVSALSQLGMAVPAFLVGILLAVLFAVALRWLPANRYVPLQRDPVEWLRHLVLPALALGLVQGAILTRYVRSAFIEVLSEDFIRTARSIGWTRLGALLRHGVRPASLQVLTVLGMQIVQLVVGAIVIENVFVLPGLGSELLRAVQARDLLEVQGIVMLLVALVIVVNAVLDMLYAVLDPRLRQGGAR